MLLVCWQVCDCAGVDCRVEHNSVDWHIMSKSVDKPTQRNPEWYTIDLKLPEGVTCEHCVLQWTWWTAHHCVYPCDKKVRPLPLAMHGSSRALREHSLHELHHMHVGKASVATAEPSCRCVASMLTGTTLSCVKTQTGR
jgi:hypothetical protein